MIDPGEPRLYFVTGYTSKLLKQQRNSFFMQLFRYKLVRGSLFMRTVDVNELVLSQGKIRESQELDLFFYIQINYEGGWLTKYKNLYLFTVFPKTP